MILSTLPLIPYSVNAEGVQDQQFVFSPNNYVITRDFKFSDGTASLADCVSSQNLVYTVHGYWGNGLKRPVGSTSNQSELVLNVNDQMVVKTEYLISSETYYDAQTHFTFYTSPDSGNYIQLSDDQISKVNAGVDGHQTNYIYTAGDFPKGTKYLKIVMSVGTISISDTPTIRDIQFFEPMANYDINDYDLSRDLKFFDGSATINADCVLSDNIVYTVPADHYSASGLKRPTGSINSNSTLIFDVKNQVVARVKYQNYNWSGFEGQTNFIFYTSPDNVNYTKLPQNFVSKTTGDATMDFTDYIYTVGNFPENTVYLKIVMSVGQLTSTWAPTIKDVIFYRAKNNYDLDYFRLAHDLAFYDGSSTLENNASVVSCDNLAYSEDAYFGNGLRRPETSANNQSTLVIDVKNQLVVRMKYQNYNLSNGVSDFEAETGFVFYTSTDNVNYAVLVDKFILKKTVAVTNALNEYTYTVGNFPVNTKYLKIVMSVGKIPVVGAPSIKDIELYQAKNNYDLSNFCLAREAVFKDGSSTLADTDSLVSYENLVDAHDFYWGSGLKRPEGSTSNKSTLLFDVDDQMIVKTKYQNYNWSNGIPNFEAETSFAFYTSPDNVNYTKVTDNCILKESYTDGIGFPYDFTGYCYTVGYFTKDTKYLKIVMSVGGIPIVLAPTINSIEFYKPKQNEYDLNYYSLAKTLKFYDGSSTLENTNSIVSSSNLVYTDDSYAGSGLRRPEGSTKNKADLVIKVDEKMIVRVKYQNYNWSYGVPNFEAETKFNFYTSTDNITYKQLLNSSVFRGTFSDTLQGNLADFKGYTYMIGDFPKDTKYLKITMSVGGIPITMAPSINSIEFYAFGTDSVEVNRGTLPSPPPPYTGPYVDVVNPILTPNIMALENFIIVDLNDTAWRYKRLINNLDFVGFTYRLMHANGQYVTDLNKTCQDGDVFQIYDGNAMQKEIYLQLMNAGDIIDEGTDEEISLYDENPQTSDASAKHMPVLGVITCLSSAGIIILKRRKRKTVSSNKQ